MDYMLPRRNDILTGQARRMVYDVHCYIKKESVDIINSLQSHKKHMDEVTDKLLEKIDITIDSLKWIERRIDASNKPVLTQTCDELLQIKVGTINTIKSEVNKLDHVIFNINQSRKRTAAATNTSLATVGRIIRSGDSSDPGAAFGSPSNKRPRAKTVTDIDNFDQGVIRRYILNFHQTNTEVLTTTKLQQKLKKDINFQGSERSLRRVLENIGFRWKKVESNRWVLLESSKIRLQRIEYLEKLKKFRQEGKPIIYIAKSYVDSSHLIPKGSTEATTKGLIPISKRERVVIIHAGSEDGFVSNALHTFKIGPKQGENHDNLNYEIYEKWLCTQLMPNLPPNSVVVVDKSSFQNKQWSVTLTSNPKKAEIQAWLTERGIQYDEALFKPQLYELVLANVERFNKTFSIEKVLAEQNHFVLNLPPYHADLNPLEMVWSNVKQFIASKSIKWDGTIVIGLIKEKVNLMDADDCQLLCKQVKDIELEYVKSDSKVDMMTEEFNFVGDSSDNDENGEPVGTSDDDDMPSTSNVAESALLPTDMLFVDFVEGD